MANITATQTVQELISYSIVKDKDSLVRLLERNGVQMPNNASNREVTTAVLLANQKSPTFKNDLANLLGNNFTKAQEDFKSFAADPADFGFTGTLGQYSGLSTGVRPIGVEGDSTKDNWGFTGLDDFYENPPKRYNAGNGTSFTAFTGGGEEFYNLTKGQQKRITIDNPKGKSKVGSALSSLASTLFTQENINAGIQLGLTSIANKQAAKQNSVQDTANTLALQQDAIQKQLNSNPPAKTSKTTTYILVGVGVVALIGIIYAVTKSSGKTTKS
jgi:hypothetical protein